MLNPSQVCGLTHRLHFSPSTLGLQRQRPFLSPQDWPAEPPMSHWQPRYTTHKHVNTRRLHHSTQSFGLKGDTTFKRCYATQPMSTHPGSQSSCAPASCRSHLYRWSRFHCKRWAYSGTGQFPFTQQVDYLEWWQEAWIRILKGFCW